MLFGNDPLYQQARAAKRGKRSLPAPLEELRQWVGDKYGVEVLTVVYDRIEIGSSEGRPRLNLIVDTTEDYAQLHSDLFSFRPHIKDAILKRFSKIVAVSALGREYDTADVHLICDDFSEEARGRAATPP